MQDNKKKYINISLCLLTIIIFIMSVTTYQANPRQFISNNERSMVKAIAAVDPVNINTATLGDLVKLKGVGAIRAKAIIAYRDEHGRFSKITDLKKVKGISKSVFKNIKGAIVI